MEISFTRRFSMAHRLLFSGSQKCETPHGHNELVTARLRYVGEPSICTDANIAMDFGELKRDWHAWIDSSVDHALQLGTSDPLIDYFRVNEPERLARILVTPGDPSTELVAALFLSKYACFLAAIDAPFVVDAIELQETPTNAVTVRKEDLALFPAVNTNGWWKRSDFSINENDDQRDYATSSDRKAPLISE